MYKASRSAWEICSQIGRRFVVLLIFFYQLFLSPIFTITFGTKCRYSVSCSTYAKQVILSHGVWKGSIMAVQRLLSCQPFGKIQ